MPPSTRRTAVVLAVSAAMLLLGGLLLAPPSPVGLSPTSVLNVLFDNRLVVGATRMVAAITLWFLVASMVARASQGQWVRRAGTVDVGDEVGAMSDDQELLQLRLASAYETIERLRRELTEALVATSERRSVLPGAAEDSRATLERSQHSRATLERAQHEAEEIQRELERSRAVRQRVLPVLRRARLLR